MQMFDRKRQSWIPNNFQESLFLIAEDIWEQVQVEQMECTASHRTVPVIFRSNTRKAFWILVLPFIDTLNISNSVWRAHKCEILNAAFISVLLMFTNFVFQLLSSSKRYSNPKKPDKSQLLFQAIIHFSLLFSSFAEFFAGMLGCKLHACELESITELVNCWQVSESDTPVLKLHFFCRSTFEECLVFPSQLPAYLSQMYLLPAMTGRKEGVKSSSSSIGLPLPQGHASSHIFSSQQDRNRTIGMPKLVWCKWMWFLIWRSISNGIRMEMCLQIQRPPRHDNMQTYNPGTVVVWSYPWIESVAFIWWKVCALHSSVRQMKKGRFVINKTDLQLVWWKNEMHLFLTSLSMSFWCLRHSGIQGTFSGAYPSSCTSSVLLPSWFTTVFAASVSFCFSQSRRVVGWDD